MQDQQNEAPVLPPGAEEGMTPLMAATAIHSHAQGLLTASYDKDKRGFSMTPEQAAAHATDLFLACFDHGAILHRSGVAAARTGLRDVYAEICAEHERQNQSIAPYGATP